MVLTKKLTARLNALLAQTDALESMAAGNDPRDTIMYKAESVTDELAAFIRENGYQK